MTHTFRLVVISVVAATPLVSVCRGQSGPRPSAAVLAARVDSIVKTDVLAQGMPSVSVVVTRGQETLLERAWGVADVANNRKAEPSTLYQLASVSKQFTAALLLKLVDRGALSLTDSIGRHLTGLRPEQRAITVEQLLNHTSGLKLDFRQQDRITELLPSDSLIAMASRDTLAAKPGTKFIYSNTGYMLLGVVIEKLYGKSYADALRDEIVRPLGLTALRYCDTEKVGVAASHLRSPQGTATPFVSNHPSQLLGSGGICSTASDLAKWNRALHGGRVLSAASYAAMTTPRGAATARNYGFGLYVRPAPWGSMAMVHDGSTAGYAAANAWYPAESLSVVVLYNAVPRVPVDVDGVITEIALGRTPAPRPATVAATPTPPQSPSTAASAATAAAPANASKFVGAYEARPGLAFIITLENGILYVTPPASMGGSKELLVPKSGLTYGLGSSDSAVTLTFMVDASDQVTGMLTRQSGTERTLKKIK